MQYTLILVSAAALVAPALAAPAIDSHLVARQNGVPDNYVWAVSGWNAGCTHGGCSYEFNVTGVTDGYIPGFTAYCGNDDSGIFLGCTLLESEINKGTGPPFIAAKLRPNQNDQIALVTVSLEFQCDSCSEPSAYKFTGSYEAVYNAFATIPGSEFGIVVDGVTAVA